MIFTRADSSDDTTVDEQVGTCNKLGMLSQQSLDAAAAAAVPTTAHRISLRVVSNIVDLPLRSFKLFYHKIAAVKRRSGEGKPGTEP